MTLSRVARTHAHAASRSTSTAQPPRRPCRPGRCDVGRGVPPATSRRLRVREGHPPAAPAAPCRPLGENHHRVWPGQGGGRQLLGHPRFCRRTRTRWLRALACIAGVRACGGICTCLEEAGRIQRLSRRNGTRDLRCTGAQTRPHHMDGELSRNVRTSDRRCQRRYRFRPRGGTGGACPPTACLCALRPTSVKARTRTRMHPSHAARATALTRAALLTPGPSPQIAT